jgi:hypothetical protein
MPAPAPSPSPVLPQVPASGGGCGWFDVSCEVSHAVTSWFSSLVTSAVNPLFALLGRSLLSTPQVGDFATVRQLWEGSLAITDAGYVLMVLAGGLLLMTGGFTAGYTVKDIAPRLLTGFAAANLSLLLIGKAISTANALSAALAGQGLNPSSAGAVMQTLTLRLVSTGGTFLVLLAVFVLILALLLAGIYVMRLMLVVLLTAVAPLALACHALPQTQGIARWWWRALAGTLLIQSAQAIVLVAALRIFFTEQWYTLLDAASPGATFDAIQLLALLYILARIPFWIGRRVWGGGPSPLRTAARYVFGALVLRRLTPMLTGRAAHRALPARRPPTGPAVASRVSPVPSPPPPPLPDGSSGCRARHSAVPRLPSGGMGTPVRHAAPPRLPDGSTGRKPAHAAQVPLPADQPRTVTAAGPARASSAARAAGSPATTSTAKTPSAPTTSSDAGTPGAGRRASRGATSASAGRHREPPRVPAAARPDGQHRRQAPVPPLPAGRGTHAAPPPLPADSIPRAAGQDRQARTTPAAGRNPASRSAGTRNGTARTTPARTQNRRTR